MFSAQLLFKVGSVSYLLRCYARMFLEITAEEAGVCKMIFPRHFLDALRTALELHLELQNHILVDDGLRRMVRYLAHDVRYDGSVLTAAIFTQC